MSHRVQALESEFGVALFRRLTYHLELTLEGERLAGEVREGLERIIRAIGDLDKNAEIGPLYVNRLPSFAARWLIPRLHRFQAALPETEVRLIAEDDPTDLWAPGSADLAIRFGRGRYPGLTTIPLMSDSVGPVCSTELLARFAPVRDVNSLLDMPLLHDSVA